MLPYPALNKNSGLFEIKSSMTNDETEEKIKRFVEILRDTDFLFFFLLSKIPIILFPRTNKTNAVNTGHVCPGIKKTSNKYEKTSGIPLTISVLTFNRKTTHNETNTMKNPAAEIIRPTKF